MDGFFQSLIPAMAIFTVAIPVATPIVMSMVASLAAIAMVEPFVIATAEQETTTDCYQQYCQTLFHLFTFLLKDAFR